MKFGVSTYCFWQAMQTGELDVLQAISLIAEMGGEHVEIVPLGYDLIAHPELIAAIRDKAAEHGLDVSNYAIGANFAGLDDEAYEQEIERVKRHVDIAAALGTKLMRHDVASSEDRSIKRFLADLPRLADACRRIADYAAGFGITTSVENHGFYVQASDRVQALVEAVCRDNFRTTLDIGNFVCVDEDPLVAVRNNISYASIVHVKDFYRRPASVDPGEGWFSSSNGTRLRGAIVGHGDLDILGALRIVRASGFDGYASIEFEGMEPCVQATKIALDNVRRLWEQAKRMEGANEDVGYHQAMESRDYRR
ncbi:Xylose isomerase domain protein TIM barrel [Paenibacillus curdlanolyticus YK9]|uniref:Xylose isomerase domain protein TIM barrel n=1 Tax=Paenibacillus curdlanolyticus YK9 TaxID=717606 RepID=E0IAA4_9BACL|nr:sugar phosphate isomerase/epimerase family protein [Paenibacillus curdlanolyticus]EFM10681.1 Xylose isomerase domain protein TIM barrel [Paenibacillus curdlanolyticus YK9]